MDVNDLTIGDARALASMFSAETKANMDADVTPFKVGSAYLIRTVTMAWTGRVVRVVGQFLVLDDAAWIADTGRYNEATTAENLNEVEPRDGEVFIGLGAIVDASEWPSDLPREVK